MNASVFFTLALVAIMGTAVVLTRDPHKQMFVLAGNGLALTLLFFALQAPDVAISETGVGAAIVPLLFLVAMTAIDNETARRRDRDGDPEDTP